MPNQLERQVAISGELPQRGHALLVEDDELSAIYATTVLRHFGWEVSLAQDGDEAVKSAVDRGFDIIFMDCHLPVRNGLEATKMIRIAELHASGSGMRIVGLTASASSEERQQCLSAGMDDVLCKPFLVAEMLQMLHLWGPGRSAN